MRAFTLAQTQLKEIFRQPITWVVLFLMPFALIGFLLYGLENVIKSESLLPSFEVAVVDKDDSPETRLLIQQFQDDDELQALITFRTVNEEKAQGLLEENKIAAILIVPEGFANGIRYGDNKPVTVIGNEQRPFQSALFQEMMNSAADLVSAAQSGVNTIYDYLKEQNLSHSYVTEVSDQMILEFTTFAFGRDNMFEKEKIKSFQGVTPFKYYSVSGFIFLLLLTGLLTMSLTSSTNTRIEERLRTFGVSSGAHVFSGFATQFVILLMHAILIIAALWILTDLKVTGHWGWSFVVFIVTIVVISAWYTFLSNLPIAEGIRVFIGFIGIVIFAAGGSLIFPESYYTGFLEWLNLSTLTHWIHISLVHSIFIENEDVLFSSLVVLGGMTGPLLFSSYVLRQVKQS
ncbi:ABC transporter permease [Pseudalkalibacillus salsuginis]|uniref:ABC transporter permease n=1 Tax=Pseudalkalibacillus salsuginis TaxID=2910972 RepID=UPI001F349EA4|nr:ABC transporter permease [Pseudalkalibacillus salsuginis]MCF6410080.1 ABC transporter permease [Pseudalkalibacillus salsuginis]